MRKIILLAFVYISLFAQNPNVYSSLGDVIYDNVDNIKKLKKIKGYDSFTFKIDKYVANVENAKKLGFAIESGNKSKSGLEYLAKLRELSSINDYFFRSAYNSFEKSIKNEDNNLFTDIVNSGLIDTKKYKTKIIGYYNLHSDEIDSSGVIQNIIDEENAKKSKKKSYYKTKKQIEEAKIKRIRKSDKVKQAELEAKLTKEVEEKKRKIIEKQEKELLR